MKKVIDRKLFSKPPKEVTDAATAVFEAMAYEALMSERIVPIETAILTGMKARNQYNHEEFITRSEDSLKLAPWDFKKYLKLKSEKLQGLGYAKRYWEGEDCICPLLEARSLLRKATWALVDALEPFTGMGYKQLSWNLDVKDRYVDLNLKWLSQHVKAKKSLAEIAKLELPALLHTDKQGDREVNNERI